jgi:endoglucanase
VYRPARMGACVRAAVLGVVAAVLTAAPAIAAPADVIRTGGPSLTSDAKRAVVLSARRLVGRPFTVTSASGRVVLGGRLRRARGSARPWRYAAVADLSALRPGSYRVRVAGRTSPRAWVITRAGTGSSSVISDILGFFAVESDGAEPSPAHGPSHMNDAVIAGVGRVDLTGGWMDAGDTLKFTGTTAYGVVAMLLAARLSPRDAPQLVAAAQVGVRWLLKAHPAPGVFVSQVGDIFFDHDRDPTLGYDPAQDDLSPVGQLAVRPALTGVGYDSGGRTAAALALAAQVEADAARRAQLVAAARAWYEAGRAQRGLAPRLPADPYRSTSGRDDMALGAIELRRAGGTAQDTREAITWLGGAEPAAPTSWDAVGALAAAELCGAAGARPPSPEAQRVGCRFLRRAAAFSTRRARRHALGTVGVLDFGTAAMQGGAGAVLAMAGERALAADARDWLLGRNPWGSSFIAGLGPSPPQSLHHWAALRPDLLRDGPGGVYEDRGVDFVTSEPAINYAASALLLFAALRAR